MPEMIVVVQHLVTSYVWTVLLYGMEGWTLKVSTMNKLEAFQMWVYRRVLSIPWTARRTNDVVLRITNKDANCYKNSIPGLHDDMNERYQLLQLRGRLREREESAGKRCHGSATLGSGQM